ncbi:NAD-dependent epimerase/dehydratase family protein [Mycolicibacterium arseniciresistens]|uniref:NAD-dependent epimerase/dehydratase family protein n=1 Tax=Mycolicibacterium arseniciresistens TaxID=3062257 RepID=A0ABT8UFN2_9MYCO|nr:NAD-dependent epimerase/dehydratase family protein [Mycolicibacterium arseniciresistens]MDO3636589.1 NAD-dependent epimerase/dehydratase family protein [Mycolicibacterium arseniciresistens]
MHESPPAPRRALVMGASGNVGAAVTRHLVARGDDVRVLLRRSSSTRGIDGLDIERHYGDIFDIPAVTAAMADRDVVYYCVVDTRAHLADPAPLFRTNVEGLRGVLDVAVHADLQRFVFLSTIGTVAVGSGGAAVDENTPFNMAGRGGPYIESRCRAEELVLRYARERGLPAVAMCVSNPYGPPDWQPRQGSLVALAAFGKMPCFVRGVGAEVVDIDDAAAALLLAADRGRNGERYIISERFMTQREMLRIAADAVGVRPPRFGLPQAAVYLAGVLAGAANRWLGRDYPLNLPSVRLMVETSPAGHDKASRELGWRPGPTEDAIRRAARFYVERRGRDEDVVKL